MDDLISRQAAIDALYEQDRVTPMTEDCLEMLLDRFEALPSAQEPLMISFAREMDRDSIEKLKEGMKNAPVLIMAVNDSAQPERKTGHWIVYPAPDEQHCGLVKCPYCREELIAEPNEYNFCPGCGADMRGEQPC